MGSVALHGFGGGGTSLNFKVVGNPQPANPKENMIWVDTDIDITSWLFNIKEPMEPAEGMMWFLTGTSSSVEFNALKKNGLQVYPLAAKQYVSGAWVAKTAKSYQGGKWVEWITYLYNNGDECIDITGGWESIAVGRSSGSGFIPTITRGESSMSFSGTASKGCIVHPANKIDLSGRKTLKFTGKLVPATSGGNYTIVGVWTEFGDTFSANRVAYFDATATVTGTQTIDVSELSGEYYVGVGVHGREGAVVMESMKVE